MLFGRFDKLEAYPTLNQQPAGGRSLTTKAREFDLEVKSVAG